MMAAQDTIQWVNPNIDGIFKLVIYSLYEEEDCDSTKQIDLAKLTPNQVVSAYDGEYSLPEVKVLDVGEGWAQVTMRGETRVLHVGEALSTDWYEYKPYWKACKIVRVKYFDEE